MIEDIPGFVEDIAAFVAARLDEVEAAAKLATPGPWRYNPNKQWMPYEDRTFRDLAAAAGEAGEEFVGAGPLDATIGVAATGPADHPQSMADALHISLHGPDVVLADVEAKRRMLDGVRRWLDPHPGQPCTNEGLFGVECELHVAATGRISPEVLPLLAMTWAGHPDYDETWRP